MRYQAVSTNARDARYRYAVLDTFTGSPVSYHTSKHRAERKARILNTQGAN